MKESNIDYESFVKLIERLAICTERLEHVASDLKEFRGQHKSEIEDLDKRVRILENNQSHHTSVVNTATKIVSIIYAVALAFLYWRMTKS